MSKMHYRTCPLCETMCGIEIEYEGTQIIAIRGDKHDVLSKGNICPKPIGLQDIHTDPDRLQKPIRRIRNNPDKKSFDDKWEEIDWEEAFEYVSEQLADIQSGHGKDSVGSYCGRSTAHNIGALLAIDPLRKIIGSRNIYTGSTVDQMPHNFVWHHMLGHQFLVPVPDINNTNYFLMLGTNPKVSNGAMMSTGANTYKKLNEIRERGGKTVLIDPRRNESVKYMSEHHFIQPNTDAMFLMGIIRTIFDKGLENPGRLNDSIKGWDQIKIEAAQFNLNRIADVTGIKREDIERIATEFAMADKAVCFGRTGVSMVEFGGLCQWLIQVLNIITGNMDKKGGLMFPKPAIDPLRFATSTWDRYRSRVSGRPEFSDEFPLAVLTEEIVTPGNGQLRGLVTLGGNLILSMADGKNSERGLQHLQFMVAVDPYLNETTRFADIILPPTGPFMKQHYDLFYHLYDTINWAKYAPALFTDANSKYTDFEILTEVLKRFAVKRAKNQLKKWFYKKVGNFVSRHVTVDRILAGGLRFGPYGKGINPFKKNALSLKKLKENPHGVFLGDLKPCLPEKLFTKDKRIQLAPQVLIDDLPRLIERFVKGGEETRQKDSEYDLKIVSRLTNRTLGWMHHSERLVKGKHPCKLMIHPKDAFRRKIFEGDFVKVTSLTGTIQLPAEVTEDIMQGVVCMPHLWGHNRPGTRQSVANTHPGVSMNDITNAGVIDKLTGNAVVNGVPVKVERIVTKKEYGQKHVVVERTE